MAVRDRQKGTHYFPVRCFGKLEFGSFDGEDGKKQVTFRILASAYRLLGNGRQPAAIEESAQS